MDIDKLTLKSQAALQAATEQARARNHQLVEPPHVLFALLSDPEGVVYPLLQKLGLSPRTLRDRTEDLLDRIPKVYGPQQDLLLSSASRQILEQAFEEARALSDEYVSTEHLLLAMVDGSGDGARRLTEAGGDRDRV